MKKYEIVEVDSLVEGFSICALKIKEQANVILKQISEGHVPCKETKDAFNDGVFDLQKQYDAMLELAEKNCQLMNYLRKTLL